jgi:hypothetical protein
MIIKSAAGRAFALLDRDRDLLGCTRADGPRTWKLLGPTGPPYGYAPPGAYGPYGPHREPMSRGANMSRHRLEPA